MPFRLFTSNRLERLSDQLADVLRTPLSSPFAPELIVVQSQGMERWLSLQLAEKLGVAANLDYPFPNRFVRELAEIAFPDQIAEEVSVYERRYLTWEIMRLLPDCLERAEFESLRNYLSGQASMLKRLQLSVRIADLFDQYLVFRPDMIRKWDKGEAVTSPEEQWQAILWREITNEKPVPHRAELGNKLIEWLAAPASAAEGLPERVTVFGISALPPFHMNILDALSAHSEVNLFLLNPCQEYWGEIHSRKQISRLEQKTSRKKDTAQFDLFDATNPDLYFEEGNRLLASMGELGRDFFDMILDDFEYESAEQFVEPEAKSLLHLLQRDILHLKSRGETSDTAEGEASRQQIPPDDRSVQIHSCHSERREIEVLQDNLLHLFDENPQLKPGDIIVMAPDIELYAPFIQAVFDLPPDDPRRIPYSIADRSFSHENEIVETFLAILNLYNSRLTATEVINILESPAVCRKFDLDETDLEFVHHLVRETRIRWGADPEHKKHLNLPPFVQNTWQSGVERMLLGYAMPTQDYQLYSDRIVPYNGVEGSDADILSGLLDFTRHLFDTAKSLDKPRSLKQWSEHFLGILDAFFAAENEALPTIYMIRRTLLELVTFQDSTGFDEPIDIRTIRHHLAHELHRESYGFGFLTGGVTFCSMLPMRSIPFKVICLIGMNNDAYPRADRKLSFDLIAKRRPKRGDRSRRKDDRYLFLETLISARETLYISYKGQSIKDNSVIPPSVLVSELLDYIETGFMVKDDEIYDHLVSQHRLQPFSPSYFDTANDNRDELFSFSRDNLIAARRLLEARGDAPPFFQEKLSEPDDSFRTVDLRDLTRFLRHPAKFLANKRLELYLPDEPEAFEDKEPFLLQQLDRYKVAEELLKCRLRGADTGDMKAALDAMGMLPHGLMGKNEIDRLDDHVADFIRKTREYLQGEKLNTLPITIEIDEFLIRGELEEIYEKGMVFYRYGSVWARDHLRAWVAHLFLNSAAPENYPRTTMLAGLDKLGKGNWRGWRLQPVQDARNILSKILKAYWYGLQKPLHFFPESAFVYANRIKRKKSERQALDAARSKWLGSGRDWERPESSDPYFNLCFKNHPDAIDREFQRCVEVIMLPLLEAEQEVN